MKRKTIHPSNLKSAEYYQENKIRKETIKKKLTFVVPEHYADLLEKLSMLLGNSKTSTVKQALDHLAELYTDILPCEQPRQGEDLTI
jgi:hypothetical protein